MGSAMAHKWRLLDLLIEKLRIRAVDPAYIPEGSFLIDYGCGDGRLLRSLENRIVRGIGYDPLVQAGSLTANISLRQLAEDGAIDLAATEVDAITCLAVLEHITPDRAQKIIDEMYRVLKKNRSLILTTPAPSAQRLLEFLAFRMHVISEKDIKDHKYYYSERELRTLLSSFSLVHFDTFMFGLNQRIIAIK